MNAKKILIGEKIKKIRENLGVEQEMFAEIISNMGYKITYTAISQYEHDKRRPNYEILTAICKIGKVQPDWMLDYDNNDSGDNPPTRAISSIESSKFNRKRIYTEILV